MTTVVLVGSLDTKGEEYAYAREKIRSLGLVTTLVDTSTRRDPAVAPDVTAAEVALAAGTDIDTVRRASDRTVVQEAMIRGASAVVARLRADNCLDAAFALGGSNNTSTAAAVFRTLPVGVPKLILTTMASGDVSHLVGPSDLVLAASVVDIAGLNRVSRAVIANAAAAVAGMALFGGGNVGETTPKPQIACSMIGLTTRAVSAAREHLENLGYEVVVFHMTGTGGMAMERLIASGSVVGVLDLTTSELTDDLFGGVSAAGPERLSTAARLGLPQVVGPGGLDMINFRQPDTVPARFAGRTTEVYNRAVTLVRITEDESVQVGETLVDRLASGRGPKPIVVLPTGGLSAIDEPGQRFYDPVADTALREAIRARAAASVAVVDVAGELDRPEFGVTAAGLLHTLITASVPTLADH